MSESDADSTPRVDFGLLAKRAAILGFATVAFSMTFYATSHGAQTFLPTVFLWLGLTVLVVGLLAITSVVIGDGIRQRNLKRIAWALPLYMGAFMACWTFSFAAYHAQFLGNAGSDLADAEKKLTDMAMIALPLERDGDTVVSRGRSNLGSDRAYTDYLKSMEQLSELINNPEKKRDIQVALNKRRQEEADREKGRREDVFKQKATTETALDQKTKALDELKRKISVLGSRIDVNGKRVKDLLDALRLEEFGPDPEPSPTGRKKEGILHADGLAGKLLPLSSCKADRNIGTSNKPESCFAALTVELKNTDQKLKTDQSDRDDAKRKIEQAEFDLKTAKEEAERAADAVKKLNPSTEAGPAELSGKGLVERLEELKKLPAAAAFDAVARECETATAVLRTMTNEGTRECRPRTVAALFADQDKLEAARAQQAAACKDSQTAKSISTALRKQMSSGASPGGGGDHSLALRDAFDRMQQDVMSPCFTAADATGVDTARARAALAAFLDRNNPSQDGISKATGKIGELFSGTASARDYFPALIALVQEFALLAAKIFWDIVAGRTATLRRREHFDLSTLDLTSHHGDPIELTAAINLLKLDEGDHSLVVSEDYCGEFSADMSNQMKRQLADLRRHGLAKKGRSTWLVRPDGVARLVDIYYKNRAPVGASGFDVPNPERGAEPGPTRRMGGGATLSMKLRASPSGRPAEQPLSSSEVPQDRHETVAAQGHRRGLRRPVILRPFN